MIKNHLSHFLHKRKWSLEISRKFRYINNFQALKNLSAIKTLLLSSVFCFYMLVKDIYNKHLIPIDEEITLKEALSLMIKSHFNGMIVLNKKQKLVGILLIQDIVSQIVPVEMKENTNLAEAMYKPHFFQDMCAKVKNKKVKEIMRKEFFKATLDMTVMTIAAEFLNTDLYVFPVVEKDEVIGIVARSELKRALALGIEITP